MTQADPRYLTSKTDEHPLDSTPTPVEGEHAGIPGGPTEEYLAAEEERRNAAPVGVQDVDLAYNATPDPVNHEVDTSELHNMEVPRHDRYADENMPGPTPDRAIPGGVTNAHPDFSVRDGGEVGPGHAGLTTTADLSTGAKPEDAGEPEADEATYGDLPAGNASTEAWREYAISQGMGPDEVEQLSRNELRDLYVSYED